MSVRTGNEFHPLKPASTKHATTRSFLSHNYHERTSRRAPPFDSTSTREVTWLTSFNNMNHEIPLKKIRDPYFMTSNNPQMTKGIVIWFKRTQNNPPPCFSSLNFKRSQITHFHQKINFQGTNLSHLEKRKTIFKHALGKDMLVPCGIHTQCTVYLPTFIY